MIPCPLCKSDTEVLVEGVFYQSHDYRLTGRGIKKNPLKVFKNLDIKRTKNFYIRCKSCGFISDNLNSLEYGILEPYRDHIKLIDYQINIRFNHL